MSPFVVRWLKFSLVAIVGCGFLAMAVYAFVKRDEIRSAQIEPPLISPPVEAVKRRPEQPGGMDIPNRDKLVFDLLDNTSQSVSSLDVISGTMPAAGPAPTVSEVLATAKAMTDEEPVSETVVSAVPLEALPQAKPASVAAAPVSVPASSTVAKPAVVKEEPKKAEAPAEEKPVATKATKTWGVQLAAVGSKADGDKSVAELSKNPALKGLTPVVSSTPDGKRYRVQFTGLKDRAAAAAVCAKVKPCFPVAPK